MMIVKYPLVLVVTFLWIGFVCAISFMEAWLKFRAPGMTIPLGLGIGRLVFNALNKVEWVFAVVITVMIFLNGDSISKSNNLLFLISVVLLILQTVWLLPLLDARASMHIEGQNPSPPTCIFIM
jgi:hypothetical protein